MASVTSVSRNSISEAIITDHREMDGYYDKYLQNMGNPDKQGPWARQLIWEVARHSIGEELVVYPLFEQYLGKKGHELAEHDRTDHQAIKNRLYKIEDVKVGTEEHAALLKDIMDHLHEHFQSEEHSDLPLLEKAVGPDKSLSAAKSFGKTKKMAPTRSHPSAPDKPPFETVAGMLAAPMDKIKDWFATFPPADEKREVDAQAKANTRN